jgi:RNA polymerase sigma-70 factor (ECF subfamily)
MDGQVDCIELVERARQGDKQSLEALARIARERLRVYVYRLTQQDDLAQEIVQESLLEMCKVLGKLQRTDRFWSWLYGIATNKLHRHYRTEKALQHAAASEERRQGTMKDREGGFENLVSQELRQIVSAAMQKLRTRHKAVLVMRCYDGMSYAEIADSMGCSEFSTRMLFMRAKQALQKELGRNGFGKGSLLAALVVFGKITAPSEAAAAQLTVPAAALNVGLVAGAIGVATTKSAIVSVAAAGVLTAGAVVATSGIGAGRSPADGNERATAAAVISPFDASQTARQAYWFYFPGEPDGPVMLRATAGPDAADPDRRVLQNAQGNYVYEGRTVQINNARMWLDDLSVFTLPTDSSDLRAFLSRRPGQAPAVKPVVARGRGLLVVIERTDDGSAEPWAETHRNVLTEDYFQTDWRSDATVVDNRDAMHQRGWTYFRVRGKLADRTVTGVGRVPFVFASARAHNPWLKLRVGDNLTILDSDTSACTIDARGTLLSRYERGSFFKGLGRPWMGLHTMDIVRRDAALRKAPFETARMDDGRRVQVTTLDGRTRLVYTIDLETDVVEKIAFSVGDAPVGVLEFEYLQDLPATGGEFTTPSTRNYQGPLSGSDGSLWLARLADGTLTH